MWLFCVFCTVSTEAGTVGSQRGAKLGPHRPCPTQSPIYHHRFLSPTKMTFTQYVDNLSGFFLFKLGLWDFFMLWCMVLTCSISLMNIPFYKYVTIYFSVQGVKPAGTSSHCSAFSVVSMKLRTECTGS